MDPLHMELQLLDTYLSAIQIVGISLKSSNMFLKMYGSYYISKARIHIENKGLVGKRLHDFT